MASAMLRCLRWVGLASLVAWFSFQSVAELFGQAEGDLPMGTRWGQIWGFSQYTPLQDGTHLRLGCLSTALAQIAFFHRLCPAGNVSYTAPNFDSTGMDFDHEPGLCDWSRFSVCPPNISSDPGMQAVARYEYAAALVVEKKWGTGDYMLSHEERVASFARHYGSQVSRWVLGSTATRDDLVGTITADIDRGLPLLMHLRGVGTGHVIWHWVVVDGYRSAYGSSFQVRLNVGHTGFDDGWFDFDSPVRLQHWPNGTVPADGSYAHVYDDVGYKEIWSIHLMTNKGNESSGQLDALNGHPPNYRPLVAGSGSHIGVWGQEASVEGNESTGQLDAVLHF